MSKINKYLFINYIKIKEYNQKNNGELNIKSKC